MELKKELSHHFAYLRQAVHAVQGKAFLDLAAFTVEVVARGAAHIFYPQFVNFASDGRVMYQQNLGSDTVSFAGWRPWFQIRPFSFAGKLAFKALVREHGFDTPPCSTNEICDMQGVIIKKDNSSFGDSIEGPFLRATDRRLKREMGEFYEKFIPGKIGKIWFWDDSPVLLELQAMPEIVGDGKKTIKELINSLPIRKNKSPELKKLARMLKYQGVSSATVLRREEKALIDFRYTSAFCVGKNIREVNFVEMTSTRPEVAEQLKRLGRLLSSVLRNEGFPMWAYTIDTIEDQNGNLFLLEANPNPFLHPSIYPLMIQDVMTVDRAH